MSTYKKNNISKTHVPQCLLQDYLRLLQWLQDWKSSVFIPITKKGNVKECSNYHTVAFISNTSEVMFKIL